MNIKSRLPPIFYVYIFHIKIIANKESIIDCLRKPEEKKDASDDHVKDHNIEDEINEMDDESNDHENIKSPCQVNDPSSSRKMN